MKATSTAGSIGKMLCQSATITILALFISGKGGACGMVYEEPSRSNSPWLFAAGLFVLSFLAVACFSALRSVRNSTRTA